MEEIYELKKASERKVDQQQIKALDSQNPREELLNNFYQSQTNFTIHLQHK